MMFSAPVCVFLFVQDETEKEVNSGAQQTHDDGEYRRQVCHALVSGELL